MRLGQIVYATIIVSCIVTCAEDEHVAGKKVAHQVLDLVDGKVSIALEISDNIESYAIIPFFPGDIAGATTGDLKTVGVTISTKVLEESTAGLVAPQGDFSGLIKPSPVFQSSRPTALQRAPETHDVLVEGDDFAYMLPDKTGLAFTRTEGKILAVGAGYVLIGDHDTVVGQTLISEIRSVLSSVIFPRMRLLISPSTERIYFVVSDRLNEWTQKGDVRGFYSPDAVTENNDRRMVFLAEPTGAGGLSDRVFMAALVHELTHLLLDYEKKDRGVTASSVVQEGLAYFMEDICGYQSVNNLKNVSSYLSSIGDGMPAFGFDGNSMGTQAERGGAYLFLKYLFDRQGGIEVNAATESGFEDGGGVAFIHNLVTSSKTGFRNVEAATDLQLAEILPVYALALSVDNTSTEMNDTYGVFKTMASGDHTIGLRTNNFTLDNISLHGVTNKRHELGQDTTLVLKSFGFSMLQFQPKKGVLNLTMTATDDAVKLAIVRMR